MATYVRTRRFNNDWKRLSSEQRKAARSALEEFVDDLNAGRRFRESLRVEGVRGRRGVFEMTWAPDGRATFEYGDSIKDSKPHIVWRRIGTRSVFVDP